MVQTLQSKKNPVLKQLTLRTSFSSLPFFHRQVQDASHAPKYLPRQTTRCTINWDPLVRCSEEYNERLTKCLLKNASARVALPNQGWLAKDKIGRWWRLVARRIKLVRKLAPATPTAPITFLERCMRLAVHIFTRIRRQTCSFAKSLTTGVRLTSQRFAAM